jgi:hypothetical protein
MWLACGNSIVLVAYAYVFFWVPQIAPGVLERAREEKAIEIAGLRNKLFWKLQDSKSR